VAGACRRQELVGLLMESVEDCNSHLLVKLCNTKTKQDRSFVIVSGQLENVNLVETVRKYMQLRPQNISHSRFFVNYVKEKCTVQPVGIHKLGSVPSIVAKFLNLENAAAYTGHCFRRTSATILGNSGGSMDEIKKHGGWRSTTVAEGYVDNLESTKISLATKIFGGHDSEENVQILNKEQLGSSGELHIRNNSNCVININYYANK